MATIRGLGRGLESLIPKSVKVEKSDAGSLIPISKIRASRYQPRQKFDQKNLEELAESIRSQGLIQPLIVSRMKDVDGEYELIAGERRWRASQMAGLTEVPVVIRKVTDKDHFQISLIENIQREDLNPIEEAQAYKRLMEEFNHTQEDLAKVIGKNRAVIANTLRLLNLPKSLQDAVISGTISAGHARNLVSIDQANLQKEVAQKILREHLTVRDVEQIVAAMKAQEGRKKARPGSFKNSEVLKLEESLQKSLGTKVEISMVGEGKNIRGAVKIAYFSLSDLERLLEIIQP